MGEKEGEGGGRGITSSFSVLVKPVSADCNLDCEYCFYHDRPTDPYRDRKRHRMSSRVLRALLRQYMPLAGANPSFGWQGGEPTLAGLDFFREVVKLEQRYGVSGQVVGNGLQTNGTFIDEEWARFLAQYNFLVGVSLDGPQELHDHYRYNAAGDGSWQRVMDGIELLRQYGVAFNILTVVSDLTAQRPAEIYSFFREQGFEFMQFIPCVERDPKSGEIAPFSVKPQQYGDFLCELFDLWWNDGEPEASLRTFENVLAAYLGQEPETCEYRERCDSYVVIEYNGDVYPCDFFVTEEWRLGNLLETPLEEIVRSPKREKFSSIKGRPYAECEDCPWDFICHHGCPRFRLGPDGRFGQHHYLCPAFKQFFAYADERFRELADRIRLRRARSAASEVRMGRRPR
ncbi:MAG: anaerobic sulfatase maturase [Chloroflexota bacterium]|nr:anaerobic sulfatase maturase [Chloroflexota bacterium]